LVHMFRDFVQHGHRLHHSHRDGGPVEFCAK
jgi:hypothetical protein